MADNNNTATATQNDVAQVENTQPQATQPEAVQETAPATTPVAPTPAPTVSAPPVSAPVQSAPSAPVNLRLNGDLGPDLQVTAEDQEHKVVEGGRSYEVTYIVIANNPEALESAQKGVRGVIEGSGGAIDNVRVSEVRRLSYPIAKRTEGIYVVANARFQKGLTEELDRHFKLNESVLRHIILREEA